MDVPSGQPQPDQRLDHERASAAANAATAMIAATTETAVNIEMAMPSPMVTAKPRTGPEPNQNSSAVAISAVTLESTMVA